METLLEDDTISTNFTYTFTFSCVLACFNEFHKVELKYYFNINV